MDRVVDARGLACPQPVILTRRAMRDAAAGAIITVVDNDNARQNVTRMAEREGYQVRTEVRAEGIFLHLTPGQASPSDQGSAPDEAAASAPDSLAQVRSAEGPLVLVVPSDQLGRGEAPELGRILMRGFFHAIGEVQHLPQAIYFLNSGVRLAVEGSPIVEDLAALEGRGVRMASCGTCLDYLGLKDRVAIGEVTNMYAIAEALLGAARVVTL